MVVIGQVLTSLRMHQKRAFLTSLLSWRTNRAEIISQ